jgi:hypothetical protein
VVVAVSARIPTAQDAQVVAFWRSLHSYWRDSVDRQPDETRAAVVDAMDGDLSFEALVASVHAVDGLWRIVRYPSGGAPAADVYELRLRTHEAGELPFTRTVASNLGLVDAVIANVKCVLTDDGLRAFLESEGDV